MSTCIALQFNVIGSGLQWESAHAAHCRLMLKSQINIELFEDDDWNYSKLVARRCINCEKIMAHFLESYYTIYRTAFYG